MAARGAEYDSSMKWEYKTLCLNLPGWPIPSVETANIDREFTKLGREGWELVSALDTNAGAGASYQLVAIFKRPREGK